MSYRSGAMVVNSGCPLDPNVMLHLKTRMNLDHIKEIENHISSGICDHPQPKNLVLRGSFDGCTPLLLACGEGYLDSVIHIIELWGGDLLEAGNYYHCVGDINSKITGATPLFIAALKGHIKIVRYLLNRDAVTSTKTSTEAEQKYAGLTPLHGATLEISRPGQSFADKFEESAIIARLLLESGADPSAVSPAGDPVWMTNFCSADFIKDLVKHGLDLKMRNASNQTILHRWLSIVHYSREIDADKSLEVVRLLLDNGADLMAQDRQGFTPIRTTVEFNQFRFMDLMLERDGTSPIEKITALELAGAKLLLSSYGHRTAALGYWYRALHLRLGNGSDPICKILPLQMRDVRALEWVTAAELEEVIQQPFKCEIQAILVKLRIHSGTSWQAFSSFVKMLLPAISHDRILKVHNDDLRYHFCVKIYWEILEGIQHFDLPELARYNQSLLRHHFYRRPTITEQVLESLTGCLVLIQKGNPLVNFEVIETSFHFIMAVDPNRCIIPSYEFFAMLAGLPKVIQHENIRNYLSHLVRQDETLMVRACKKEDLVTLRFLLRIGADPNSGGYQPLLAITGSEAGHLLWVYGAQPYRVNGYGRTAVDTWMEINCGGEGVLSSAWLTRPDWCRNTVPKLKYLSTKIIHMHQISYTKLAPLLISFVEEH